MAGRDQQPGLWGSCAAANEPAGRRRLVNGVERNPIQPAPRPIPRAAFTLIELLVVLAIIGLLARLTLPALGRAKAQATGAACLSNLQQLQVCWQMYVDDFQGRVPPNRSVRVQGVWRSTPDSWIGFSSAPHDPDPRPIEQGVLFRYNYNRSLALYRCPADRSRARTVDGRQLAPRRTRSYSMNGNLGGRTNEVQNTVARYQAIPNPAQLFVFIDEAEDSIDDAHFLVWPNPDTRWVNLPAGRHAQTGVLSFADGHVEKWAWQWPKKFSPRQSYWKMVESPQDLADLRRLQGSVLPLLTFIPQQ
ncbi:MAG: type II secretion system GspH family protein [Verrucomicrobia bacterium]|nr:type II secretion system GspH family protein [Verrucomicrobiota bacterium]